MGSVTHMKTNNANLSRVARSRGSRRGGDGWGFDLMTLDDLLRYRDQMTSDPGYQLAPDQAQALNDAIDEARAQPQTMTLNIAGATAQINV